MIRAIGYAGAQTTLTAQEHYERGYNHAEAGDRAEAIVVLREAMNDAKSATVRNAAAMMLADALKETGQASEAIEVLKSALAANTR